jgi:hypothetical protein
MSQQYNSRQLLSLGAVIALTPMLRLYPSQSAALVGRAGWLTPLAALPLGVAWAWGMARFLQRRKPGEHFPDLILRLGGRPALAVLTGWALLYAAFVLRSGADRLVGTVYPGASPALFSQLIGLIALLAALSTPRTLARMGRMLLPILYGVLALLLFFAFSSIDPGNLLPVGAQDVWPVLRATPLPLDIIAGTGTALCFLAGGAEDGGPRFSRLSVWAAGLCLLASLLTAAVTGSFGATLTAQLARPFFVLVRTLRFFRTVERVEALVVMLWIFPDFLITALFLWTGQYGLRLLCGFRPDDQLRERLDFSEGRVLTWAFGAAATLLALFLAPDPAALERWSTAIIPAANLLFVFVFLPTIYFVGRNRAA